MNKIQALAKVALVVLGAFILMQLILLFVHTIPSILPLLARPFEAEEVIRAILTISVYSVIAVVVIYHLILRAEVWAKKNYFR